MFGKSIIAALLAFGAGDDTRPIQEDRLAVICFKSGEQVSGTNKICYYDCLSGTVAITINSLSFFPLTIDR